MEDGTVHFELRWVPLIFLSAALAEGAILYFLSTHGYRWKGFFCSLIDYLGRMWVVEVFLAFNVAAPLLIWAERHRALDFPSPGPAAVATVFLLEEFCY